MKNEFGAVLDKSGYAPSILGAHNFCYLCYKGGDLARHEIFHGAFRNRSKKYGLWVNLCPACHDRLHFSGGKTDLLMKEHAQRQAMEVYKWTTEEWRLKFGKNYL